jgi:hypothetical protein
MSRIGDQVFGQVYAFAGNPPQLFRFSLVIFAKIMDLMNKLFESGPVWLLGVGCVMGEDENLVFEGFVESGILQA